MDALTDTESDEIRSVCRSGEMSETVVTAVAEAKGINPLDLEPLYSVIDPDALNSMFCPSVGTPPAQIELSFSMAGCEVVIHGDGEVAVIPPAETDESPATIASQED